MILKKEFVVELTEQSDAPEERHVMIKVKLPPARNRGSRIKIQTENVQEYLEGEGYRVLSWKSISSVTNTKPGSEIGIWVAQVALAPMAVSLFEAKAVADKNFEKVESALAREVDRDASVPTNWEDEETDRAAIRKTRTANNRSKKVSNE